MTSHTYHPDTHEYGLVDDCPRCQEHAEHPFSSLDNRNLERLIRTAMEDAHYASNLEAIAAAKIRSAIAEGRRIYDLAPDIFEMEESRA